MHFSSVSLKYFTTSANNNNTIKLSSSYTAFSQAFMVNHFSDVM